MKIQNGLGITLLVLGVGLTAFGSIPTEKADSRDLDRVDLIVKLEVDGKVVIEKSLTPRFGEKRTLARTFYGDKTEYELEVMPSRYNNNAALVEARITKISDLGLTKKATLLGTPKIITLNKVDASVEASSKGISYKLSILPKFQNL